MSFFFFLPLFFFFYKIWLRCFLWITCRNEVPFTPKTEIFLFLRKMEDIFLWSGGPRQEIWCSFRGRAGHFFVFFMYPIFYHLFFYEYLLEMRSHSHQNGQISIFLENERHMSLIEQIWRSRQEILCSFRGLAEKSDILATVTENTKTHFPNHMKINKKNY